MNEQSNVIGHDAASERLPWYVNGTLSDEEHAQVAAHLATCADCRAALALCEEMSAAAKSDRAVPILPSTTADQLLLRPGVKSGKLWPAAVSWRAAAALVFLGVAAALLTMQFVRPDPPNQRFTTVTGGTSLTSMNYVFDIRFEQTAGIAVRNRVLDEIGGDAQVVDEAGGVYRVTLALPPQSLSDLDARAQALRRRNEIAAADVVALQVPVR